MKVGGRREMIVPASMSFHEVPLVYVIDLLRVKKIGSASHAPGLPKGQAKGREQDLAMSEKEIAKLPKLTIARQSGPPPRNIKIIDLRKGSGAAVSMRNAIHVSYFQVRYPEVRKRSRTGHYGPRSYTLDETVKGWTVGLRGMRVGGRRELILPPKLVYPRWKPSWGYTPYVSIYLIDLLAVEPPTDPYGRRWKLKPKPARQGCSSISSTRTNLTRGRPCGSPRPTSAWSIACQSSKLT